MFLVCCFRQRTYVAQGHVNGVLNETRTHSFLLAERFSGFVWGYIDVTPFFCVSILSDFTPIGLWYLICYKVFVVLHWVCVLTWFWIPLTVISLSLSLSLYIYIYIWFGLDFSSVCGYNFGLELFFLVVRFEIYW